MGPIGKWRIGEVGIEGWASDSGWNSGDGRIFFGVVNRGLVFNSGWVLSGVRGGRGRLCG